jgi:hypothetical protein
MLTPSDSLHTLKGPHTHRCMIYSTHTSRAVCNASCCVAGSSWLRSGYMPRHCVAVLFVGEPGLSWSQHLILMVRCDRLPAVRVMLSDREELSRGLGPLSRHARRHGSGRCPVPHETAVPGHVPRDAGAPLPTASGDRSTANDHRRITAQLRGGWAPARSRVCRRSTTPSDRACRVSHVVCLRRRGSGSCSGSASASSWSSRRSDRLGACWRAAPRCCCGVDLHQLVAVQVSQCADL